MSFMSWERCARRDANIPIERHIRQAFVCQKVENRLLSILYLEGTDSLCYGLSIFTRMGVTNLLGVIFVSSNWGVLIVVVIVYLSVISILTFTNT